MGLGGSRGLGGACLGRGGGSLTEAKLGQEVLKSATPRVLG